MSMRRRYRVVMVFTVLVVFCAMLVWWLGHRARVVDAKASPSTTMTVAKRSIPLTLVFNSTIAPIRSQTVPSRFEGVISHVDFHYGDVLKKGQVLFGLESTQLASDYRTRVTDYLKSKNAYAVAKTKFNGTEKLYQHHLVDRESYESEKNALQSDLLGLMNHEQSLQDFLQYLPASYRFDLQQLHLDDTTQIRGLLRQSVASIDMTAPIAGVALSVDKDSEQAMVVGAQIEKNKSLLLIGDLSGVKLDFKVPQHQLRSVKVGDAVEVTSQGMPGVTLQGNIDHLGAEAKAEGNESLFAATAVVPALSGDERAKLRSGMTAQVTLHVVQPEAIYIPIKAVAIRDGHKQVAVLEQDKPHWVDVETASTSDDLVEISHGLAAGQQFTVPG